MGNHIVIQGYYGADNTGDEAILAAIISGLGQEAKKRGVEPPRITVLSRDPRATEEQHGVQSVYTGRMFSGLSQVISTIKSSQVFITGGGGLLQDNHARIVPYWLSRVVLAKLFRKPVVFYAQGVGPIHRKLSKILIRWILPRLDVITVRDADSKQVLVDLGVPQEQVQLTADPAFALDPISWEQLQKKMQRASCPIDLDGQDTSMWVGVSLRPWRGLEQYLPELAAYLDDLAARGVNILFVPMQFQPDLEVSQQVRDMMTCRDRAWIMDCPLTPREILTLLSRMDMNISMRLHAAIFSLKSGVLTLGLSYQPKVSGVFKEMGQDEQVFALDQVSRAQLLTSTDAILARQNSITEQLFNQAHRLEKLAGVTAKLTLDCLS